MKSPLPRKPIFGRALAAAALVLLALAGPASAAIAPDVAHSPNAEDMRTAYWVMLVVAAIVVVGFAGALLDVARKNSSRGRFEEPRRLTAGSGAITRVGGGLGLVVVVLFIFGVVMSDGVKQATAEEGTEELDIQAVGQQWLWRFEYPQQAEGAASPGIATVFSFTELVVPVDTKINVTLDSTDVLHSWFVPALGPQVMAVPGKVTETSFVADEEGLYTGRSTVFSGTAFPAMRIRVKVVSADEYRTYVDGLTQNLATGQDAVSVSEPAGSTETE